MMVTERRYIAVCDFPGCSVRQVIHGVELIEPAKAKARRDGWTFTEKANGERHARCPDHAWLYTAPRGRHPVWGKKEGVA